MGNKSTLRLEIVGSRVRSRRLSLGLTIAELAAAVDVGKSSIANWEAGKNSPHPGALARLCEALKAPKEYLTGEIDNPFRGLVNETPEEHRANIQHAIQPAMEARRSPDGRPKCALHPKVWERAEALLDHYESTTVDDAVSKMINEKHQEFLSGAIRPWRGSDSTPEETQILLENSLATLAEIDAADGGEVSFLQFNNKELNTFLSLAEYARKAIDARAKESPSPSLSPHEQAMQRHKEKMAEHDSKIAKMRNKFSDEDDESHLGDLDAPENS